MAFGGGMKKVAPKQTRIKKLEKKVAKIAANNPVETFKYLGPWGLSHTLSAAGVSNNFNFVEAESALPGNTALDAKALTLRGRLSTPIAQTVTTFVRMILFIDKDGSDYSAATDILETANPFGMYHRENVPTDYRILLDRTYRLAPGASSSEGGDNININISKKLNFKQKQDNGTILSNDLRLLLVTDATANFPVFDYSYVTHSSG